MMEKYPNTKVVCVSNSNDQHDYIVKKAKDKGVSNRVVHIKANIKDFTATSFGE